MSVEKIQRFGKRLQHFTLLMIAITPVALLTAVGVKGPLVFVSVPSGVVINYHILNLQNSILIVAISALTPATYVICFSLLYKLFGFYASGIVFSKENVVAIRQIGYVLMAVDVVRIMQSAVMGPVLTALEVVKGYFTIELGISMLIVGLFIVLISHVMEMGLDIYERDKLTV